MNADTPLLGIGVRASQTKQEQVIRTFSCHYSVKGKGWSVSRLTSNTFRVIATKA